MVLYTPLLRIYPCYRDILWIHYIMGEKETLSILNGWKLMRLLFILLCFFLVVQVLHGLHSIKEFCMHFRPPILFAPPCRTHRASEAGALSCVWRVFTHVAWRCSAGRFCFIPDSWTLTACKLLVKAGEHSVSHSIKSATRKIWIPQTQKSVLRFPPICTFSYLHLPQTKVRPRGTAWSGGLWGKGLALRISVSSLVPHSQRTYSEGAGRTE